MKNVRKLSSCKSLPLLPFVACIVKECKLNGFGSMQISFKVMLNTNISACILHY